jgi:hypothetical protein
MEARAAGIQFVLDGDDLVLEAGAPPPPAMLKLLSQHKSAIVLWLRQGADGWSAEDWQAYFDERAGIAEFDGGQPREQAEAMAFACCVTEWMNQHPVISSPGRCLACEGGERQGDPLMPYGTITHGHTWLHSRCWRDWYDAQKGDAVAALMAMGIKDRVKFAEDFGKIGGA